MAALEGCIYSDRGHDQQVFLRAVRPAPNPGKSSGEVPTPGESVANRAIVDRPHSPGGPPHDVIPPPPSGDEPWCPVWPDNVHETGVSPRRTVWIPPSWPPRWSRSSELEEGPGHGPDPRFLCPSGSLMTAMAVLA